MIPDEAKTNLDFILPNNARHLCLPYGFFEEGLRRMQDLDGFRFVRRNRISPTFGRGFDC